MSKISISYEGKNSGKISWKFGLKIFKGIYTALDLLGDFNDHIEVVTAKPEAGLSLFCDTINFGIIINKNSLNIGDIYLSVEQTKEDGTKIENFENKVTKKIQEAVNRRLQSCLHANKVEQEELEERISNLSQDNKESE